jgi:hypothetical protein
MRATRSVVRGAARYAAAVAAIVAIAAGSAGADDGDGEVDVCDDPIDEPIAVPWREAGADAARSACLHPDVGLRLGGRVLIDEPDAYRTLGSDATLHARFVEDGVFEWGIAFRIVDLAYVQNGMWKLTEVSYGPLIGHAAVGRRTRLGGRPLQQALALRLGVPFTQSRLDGSSGSAQLAAMATWQVRPRLRLHARAMLLGWYGTSSTGTSSRGAVAVATDVTWPVIAWLTPNVGVDAQLGWYGAGLDHVAVRAGVAWRVRGQWRADVAAGRPLVGAERQDVAVTLGVRRDLQ